MCIRDSLYQLQIGDLRPVSDPIPLSVPHLSGNEWKYVKECLDTNAVSAVGRFIELFERKVADFTGATSAVATVNGTSALHVALRVLDVGPGDEVICPDFTFVAPVNAVRYCGAVPVLLDVSRDSATLDPMAVAAFLKDGCKRVAGQTINRRTDRRVKALLPVHMYGHPADLDPLREMASEHGLFMVEDAAECLGAEYKGVRIGKSGDLVCLSFNGNKVVTAGCGGMVLASRPEWSRRARHLVTQARSHPTDYIHDEIGFNYRLPNLNAAIGCAQMENLDLHLKRKRQIADSYAQAIREIPGLSMLCEREWASSTYWLNTMLIDREVYGRDVVETMNALTASGIQARRVWPPLHSQAPYRDCPHSGSPHSQWMFEHALNLPSSVGLSDSDLSRVIAALRG